MDAMTFPDGTLGDQSSVKGFKVVGTDGRAGRVSWASYKPGDSYLVVTIGMLRRAHHVVPAGAVTSVRDGEVRVAMSRAQIKHLPDLPHPEAPVGAASVEQMINAFEREYALSRRN